VPGRPGALNVRPTAPAPRAFLFSVRASLGPDCPFRRHRSASRLRISGSGLPANHRVIVWGGMPLVASEQRLPPAPTIQRFGDGPQIAKAEGLLRTGRIRPL
jgi:hypothetical protein